MIIKFLLEGSVHVPDQGIQGIPARYFLSLIISLNFLRNILSIETSFSDLQIFWHAICSNAVEKRDGKLVFNKEQFGKLPRWGLMDSVTDELLVRDEYVRLLDRIQSNPGLKFILVRGTKGIGKSLFIYFLMYSLVKEALDQSNRIPSFLLIYAPQSRYIFSANGVVNPDSGNLTDYIISDDFFDTKRSCRRWNLHIDSYGSVERITPFSDAIKNAGGVDLTMGVLPLREIQALSDMQVGNFIYTIFGGSARYLQAMRKTTYSRNDVMYEIIRQQLLEFISVGLLRLQHF